MQIWAACAQDSARHCALDDTASCLLEAVILQLAHHVLAVARVVAAGAHWWAQQLHLERMLALGGRPLACIYTAFTSSPHNTLPAAKGLHPDALHAGHKAVGGTGSGAGFIAAAGAKAALQLGRDVP